MLPTTWHTPTHAPITLSYLPLLAPHNISGTHQAYLEELFGATDVVAALAQYAASFSSSSYPTNNDGEDEEGGVEERGKVLPLSLYIRLEQARLAAAASQQEEVEEESLEAAAAAAQVGRCMCACVWDVWEG